MVSTSTADRNLADYYHWEEPGRGIRIYMRSGMADRLQADVLRSGEREAGGILLGRVEGEEGPAVFIEDFVPVECSYHDGPLYSLSEQDTASLEAALLRAALAACDTGAPSVLGYYRSHNRDGLSLASSDLELIDSYFQEPASVFLLVKAVLGAKACTAGFFFWEDGRIQSEFSALEVALGGVPSLPSAEPQPDLPDLPDDLAEIFRRAALPTAPLPAEVNEPPAVTAPTRRPGNARRFWRDFFLRTLIVSLAAVTVVLSVLTYLGTTRPSRESVAASTPTSRMLGLEVKRIPPDLLVTWNQEAPEIAAARHASLFIRDGSRQRILDLDSVQLSTGSVLYMPAGDDIQFRLEVYGAKGQSMAQSVRVLLPQAGAATRR